MYTERILISTITANIEVCFIQMQCVSEALVCTFKSFDLIIVLLKISVFHQKLQICHHKVER